MPETMSHASSTSTPCTTSDAGRPDGIPGPVPGSRGTGSPTGPRRLHSRIGVGLAGGFYPAPHRYRLYLCTDCPRSLRVSITLDLLGLGDFVATTPLTHTGDAGQVSDGFAALRRAYEATWHHYEGPLTAPALCDRWTGRVVSNHTPDILRDLAGLAVRTGTGLPALRPPARAADIDALGELLDADVVPAAAPHRRSAALGRLNRRLASAPYAAGRDLTAADVDLWVALVHLEDPDALAPYGHLRAYVRRLAAHPAFRGRTSRAGAPQPRAARPR
ncbi:glutathione S-transferase family protein [Streptomyces sp. NPDC005551]|uniref:glutathione S-transferase family protein n=1 Tax=unclassified Streptomyces TaxID=2593676 RepID=UPI0033C5767A